METETETEHGVLWPETGEVEPTETREAAAELAGKYPAWNGAVVSRSIVRGRWIAEGETCGALWAHCRLKCCYPCDHNDPCPHHGDDLL